MTANPNGRHARCAGHRCQTYHASQEYSRMTALNAADGVMTGRQ